MPLNSKVFAGDLPELVPKIRLDVVTKLSEGKRYREDESSRDKK